MIEIYTTEPQTVHNTPAMNISKGYFYIVNTLLKETH